ncbi:MAG: ABC transporter permease [bacterium]|nr:ABC transporter permease [bacterium]
MPDDLNQSSRTRAALRLVARFAAPLLALACVILFFAIADSIWGDGKFATVGNLRFVLVQISVVTVAALGMTVVIIAGGIDLSVGTALALAATTLAWGLREDVYELTTTGTNFRTVSAEFTDAQESLYQADEASKPAIRTLIEQRLEALKSITQKKLDLAVARAEHDAENEDLANSAKRMREKIEQLNNPEFELRRNDAEWFRGVPNASLSAPMAVLLCLFAGLLAGVINGVLVSLLKMAPFIVTLGTMTIYLGIGHLISASVPIRPSLEQVPAWLTRLVGNQPDELLLGLAPGVWLLFLLAIALTMVLRLTVFGRYVFAIGSNESTARLCGVNVSWYKVMIYAVGGLFVGIAGIYQFTRLSTGNPESGLGLELKIIAAVVIGGGSLNGGRGAVGGTLAGAAIMAAIESGCTQIGVPNPVQRIILGVIIIGAVGIDRLQQKWAEKSN